MLIYSHKHFDREYDLDFSISNSKHGFVRPFTFCPSDTESSFITVLICNYKITMNLNFFPCLWFFRFLLWIIHFFYRNSVFPLFDLWGSFIISGCNSLSAVNFKYFFPVCGLETFLRVWRKPCLIKISVVCLLKCLAYPFPPCYSVVGTP